MSLAGFNNPLKDAYCPSQARCVAPKRHVKNYNTRFEAHDSLKQYKFGQTAHSIITLESNNGGTMTEKKIRVLVAKPGLDGHDRGAKVVARALRDAGMEVIYTGLRQTPEMIAEAALQEDVDVVGLSILSGAHMALAPRILELLKANGQEGVKVFIGGIVPDDDMPKLKEMGITGIYGPGASTEDIIKDIREAAK
jgi:methylmalonyl-CoA mutase C-terminal domain/subunit